MDRAARIVAGEGKDMTDRKLLEAAAKAAGIEFNNKRSPTGNVALYCATAGWWNPLTSDADALRLAVKMGVDVMHTNIHSPQVHAMADHEVACIENSATDPYAATRRAIVRAAAEIGRGMTQKVSNDYLPEDNYYKTQADAMPAERSKT